MAEYCPRSEPVIHAECVDRSAHRMGCSWKAICEVSFIHVAQIAHRGDGGKKSRVLAIENA